MSYIKAETILPREVVELIQKYVDGDCIYIPRKENARKAWGQSTQIRSELKQRDVNIYMDYLEGMPTAEIADKYYLSQKSIQRIVCLQKKQSA